MAPGMWPSAVRCWRSIQEADTGGCLPAGALRESVLHGPALSVTAGSFALRSACHLNSALYLFRLAMTHPQRTIALSLTCPQR